MPMLPVPPSLTQSAQNPLGQSVSPENFLMAAADMHQKGEFQNMPVPKAGPELAQPAQKHQKRRMQIVK